MATPTEPRYTAADHALAALFDALQRAIGVADGEHAELCHVLDPNPGTCVPLPGVPHPKPCAECGGPTPQHRGPWCSTRCRNADDRHDPTTT